MATDLAPVTPSVLKWARLTVGVGVEEAARRARVTPNRLEDWERGASEPTVAKLRQLAKLYQRPFAVFFLPEPPSDFDTLRDFRKLPDNPDRSWSRALHKVYRRAVLQQEIAAELLQGQGKASRTIPALNLQHSPEAAAEIARRCLGVPLDGQFSWRRPTTAFSGWLEAVEALGVLVLRTSEVPLEEMRGFSLGSHDVPVVMVNALDAPAGQVFTLLHEFAHLTLRQGGLCDLLEPDGNEGKRIEVWCNAVAGAILLPAASLLDDEIVRPPGEREWDDEVLADLARKYGVSREAVLRRLVTLRRASAESYVESRRKYLLSYAMRRDEQRKLRSSTKGGPPPHRMVIRDQGKPFVRLVLDAYHREALTPSSLSSLLGIKLKHLAALESEAGSVA